MAAPTYTDIAEELLVCQICLEDYKQPKMLPCLHTFCQPCLEQMMAAKPGEQLTCPTCRQDVPLPENGVQGLKDNFLLGKLRDLLQQQPKGEGDKDPQEDGAPCTGCEVGKWARVYCVECTDYLCQTCYDAHSRLKATRSHNVMTVEEVKTGMMNTERARETSKCKVHNELNKFYCDTCREIICLHCVVTTHKDHSYAEIEKAAEREREKIKEKLWEARNTAGEREIWIKKLRSKQDRWPQVQSTEEQIQRQAMAIIETVNKVKNDRISQLRVMIADEQKELDLTIEAAELDLASANGCIRFTDNVLEYGSPAEVMSVAKDLTSRLELIERIEQTESLKTAALEKVELDKGIMNLTLNTPAVDFEQKVVKLMGRVKQGAAATADASNEPVGPYRGTPKLLKVVGKDGKDDGDFQLPASLVVTGEGNVVVTDYGNKRLQSFGQDGSFKKKVDLGFSPLSIAVMENGDFLVTGDKHKIHILDKLGRDSGVIQVKEAAGTGETTRGIAVNGLGHIIVTVGYHVFVLGHRGDVLHKFGNNVQGQQQLSSDLRLTTNSLNQIIVSENDAHNVKVFDPTGRYLFTCGAEGSGPGQLCYPYCVVTDSEDNIIVVDGHNHRVSVFSPDGTFIRHLLTREEHGLNYPLGVTLTQEGLLVASDCHSIKFFHTV